VLKNICQFCLPKENTNLQIGDTYYRSQLLLTQIVYDTDAISQMKRPGMLVRMFKLDPKRRLITVKNNSNNSSNDNIYTIKIISLFNISKQIFNIIIFIIWEWLELYLAPKRNHLLQTRLDYQPLFRKRPCASIPNLRDRRKSGWKLGIKRFLPIISSSGPWLGDTMMTKNSAVSSWS